MGHEKCLKCADEHRQLAEWLKELKQLREQTQEPCEDCVSRAKTMEICKSRGHDNIVDKKVKELIGERKKGFWIMTNDYITAAYESIDYVKCSCCGEESLEEGDFCPNCGARMESEE